MQTQRSHSSLQAITQCLPVDQVEELQQVTMETKELLADILNQKVCETSIHPLLYRKRLAVCEAELTREIMDRMEPDTKEAFVKILASFQDEQLQEIVRKKLISELKDQYFSQDASDQELFEIMTSGKSQNKIHLEYGSETISGVLPETFQHQALHSLSLDIEEIMALPKVKLGEYFQQCTNLRHLEAHHLPNTSQGIETLARVLMHIPNLTSFYPRGDEWNTLSVSSYMLLKSHLPNLKHLTLDQWNFESNESVRSLIHLTQGVQDLQFHSLRLGVEPIGDFYQSLTELRALTLPGHTLAMMNLSEIRTLFQNTSQVRSLELDNLDLEYFSPEKWECIFQSLPHLQHLSLRSIYFPNTESYTLKYLTMIPPLVSVSFSEYGDVPFPLPEILEACFQRQPHLKHLDLSSIETQEISLLHWQAILKNVPELESLDLSKTNLALFDAQYFEVLKSLKKLISINLKLTHLQDLSDEHLRALAQSIRHIKYINMEGWNNYLTPDKMMIVQSILHEQNNIIFGLEETDW